MSCRTSEIRLRKEALLKVREKWRASQLRTLSSLNSAADQDRRAKGSFWVSRVTLPAPQEPDASQALFGAINELSDPADEKLGYQKGPVADIPAEWVSWRSDGDAKAPEPEITPKEKYLKIQKETGENPITVLYVHGGGFTTGSPAIFRSTTSSLAHATGGQVLALKYRLAPTYTMPTQLLDLTIAYLSLLNPSSEAFHDAVPARRIILAGDSSGAGLILSFTALLLHLRRNKHTSIRFNGKKLPDELLPAGQALISPFPYSSCHLPMFFDPVLVESDILLEQTPLLHPSRPDEPGFWPTDPPREHWLCRKHMLNHPLVEPLLIPDEMWTGAPPVWVALGQERAASGTWMLASTMRRAGVKVTCVEFEGMCHVWHMLLPKSPSAAGAMKKWGAAILDMAHGKSLHGGSIQVQEGTLNEININGPEEFRTKDQWRYYTKLIKENNNDAPVWYGKAKRKSKSHI